MLESKFKLLKSEVIKSLRNRFSKFRAQAEKVLIASPEFIMPNSNHPDCEMSRHQHYAKAKAGEKYGEATPPLSDALAFDEFPNSLRRCLELHIQIKG